MNVNNLTSPLYEIHEINETFETNGETNGTSNCLNNLNNTNNLNKPCPRRMETNRRKGAKGICLHPLTMLSKSETSARNRTLGERGGQVDNSYQTSHYATRSYTMKIKEVMDAIFRDKNKIPFSLLKALFIPFEAKIRPGFTPIHRPLGGLMLALSHVIIIGELS